MRVLLTTIPALGHFHPLVPHAQALREAGHDVAFNSGLPLLAADTLSALCLGGKPIRKGPGGAATSEIEALCRLCSWPAI